MISFDSKNIRTWGLLGIGPSVILAGLAEVMRNNPDVFFITADIGRPNAVNKLPPELHDRVFNVGIAEQNMMAVAGGMALEGKQVFVLSYAPFVTYRCADQFRHLMGNFKLNIKAIGTAAGFTGCSGGSSLTAISDIGFVRSVPNVTVISPADCAEAVKAVLALSETKGPAYLRLCGFQRLPMVYKNDFDFTIGKANVLREGSGVAILATGANIVTEAIKAGEELGATVADVHTIKPLDTELLDRLRENHSLIVTVEEHNIIGGLGSAVAEHISNITFARGGGNNSSSADRNNQRSDSIGLSDVYAQQNRYHCRGNNITNQTRIPRLLRLGITDEAIPSVNRSFMLGKYALTAEGIIQKIHTDIEEEFFYHDQSGKIQQCVY